MSKTIFISYAREDFGTAEKLYQDLKKLGFEPWLDTHSLLPGSRWKSAIKTAIHNSLFFVALLSSQAVGKRGYIQKEVKEALEILDEFPESEIFVIPVRLDNCKPMHEKLNELNWVNLFPSYESGLQKIVQALNSKDLVSIKQEAEKGLTTKADVIVSSEFDSTIQNSETTQIIELVKQDLTFEHFIIETIADTRVEKAIRTKALQAFLEAGKRNTQLIQDLLNKTEADIRYFTLRKAIEFELTVDESTLHKLFADVSNDIVKNAIILADILIKQSKVSVEVLGDLHIAKHSYWVIRSTAIATIINADAQQSVSILAKYTTTTYHVSRKLICNYFKRRHIENRLDEVDRGKATELLKTYIADGHSSIAVQKIMQKTLQLISLDISAINHPSQKNTIANLKNQLDEKITILFLGVNPVDTNRLRLDQEIREITDVLQGAKYRDQFTIEQAWALRTKDLQNALLRFQPYIVHFSGHGTSNNELVFEDDNGISKPVPPKALSDLFANLRDNIRLVVLNTCYSEAQAQAIAEHIDCVIAIDNVIEDIAVINFISSFYQALAYGKDVGTAFELGKNRLRLEAHCNHDSLKLLVKPTINPKALLFI